MLYPTHKRYGQVFGLTGIAIGASLGLLPVVNISEMNSLGEMSGEIIVSGLFMYACYQGALFGAEFPDIDSPGSIPARKHYFIRQLFKAFQVNHRGKFSHDFISLLILFGGIYLSLLLGLGPIMEGLLYAGVGNSELTPLIALFSNGGLLLNLALSYTVFALIGAYSHLIADASTKQGVWLFWSIKIHIVPVFITKWSFGGKKPFEKIFNTGTGWEMLNRNLYTYILLPISGIAGILMMFV